MITIIFCPVRSLCGVSSMGMVENLRAFMGDGRANSLTPSIAPWKASGFAKIQPSAESITLTFMPKFEEQLDGIYAETRQIWREWLAQNHRTASGIWLIYYKVASSQPSVRYSEAVKEALCFGWIDSKVKSLDGDRYKQIFTPRKPKSVWSKLNKQYIEELIKQGLMTKAGLEKIARAKEDGSWFTLDAVEALTVPADLSQALETNPAARKNFEALTSSIRKNILFWIQSARRTETRVKRIEQTLEAMAQNRSPLAR